jgi:cytoskeletal protein CcmA (bactofilin family)
VDGQIDGDVCCGTVLISERSQITGNVIAKDVVVRGKGCRKHQGNARNAAE